MASHGQRGNEKSRLCTMDESSILRRRGLQVGEPDAAASVCVCVRVRGHTCVCGWSGADTLLLCAAALTRLPHRDLERLGCGWEAGSGFYFFFFYLAGTACCMLIILLMSDWMEERWEVSFKLTENRHWPIVVDLCANSCLSFF